MIVKKSLVLKSVSGGEEKGVLSIQAQSDEIEGKLHLYGFGSEPRGILSLGITTTEGVIKAGLTKQANMQYTFSTNAKNLPDTFSCAVINFLGGEFAPILFGSCGETSLQDKLSQVTAALKDAQSTKEVEDVLDDYNLDYDEDLKQEIENDIDRAMKNDCKNDCASCIYKKYFYQSEYGIDAQGSAAQPAQAQAAQAKEEDTQKTVLPQSQEGWFFNEIKTQVETLFSENKPEEFLQEAIPDSKWVKVDLDQGGDYYVFGLIYEDEQLRYVCYGVPSLYSPQPPKHLSGYPVWFPIDKDKKEGFGYWLTYQDAGTGESIKAIIE